MISRHIFAFMKNKLFLALVVAALLCLAGWTAHAQLQRNHPTAQLWEYTEAELDPRFMSTQKLNQAGTQGWELVAVVQACQPPWQPLPNVNSAPT